MITWSRPLLAAAAAASFCDGLAFPWSLSLPRRAAPSASLRAVPLAPVAVGPPGSPAPPAGGRRPIVAGNWKLNPTTRAEAAELLAGLAAGGAGGAAGAEVVVFPPLPFLSDALDVLAGTGIKVGAQNAGSNLKGAFTGETAPSMLASAGCSHVLLGHSERRSLFGETDSSINSRLLACLAEEALTAVLCVGETLDEYEAGLMTSIVDTQLRKGLAGVSAPDLLAGRVVVAYEPVWAIGTGLVATPDQAQAAHVAVRHTLTAMYPGDPAVAATVRIQYGGSVSPDSVAALMAMPDVDGALVGGASLVADSFTKIVSGAGGGGIAAAPAAPSPPKATQQAAVSTAGFAHAPAAFFAVDALAAKGPRKGADVGAPHDAAAALGKAGRTSVGSWWCAAGGWPSPTPRATTEVFYVFSGHGCVTDADGTRSFMGPGDLVVLPKGWAGRWDVLEDLHKVWATADHPDVPGGSTGAVVGPYADFAPQHLTPHGDDGARGPGASRTLVDNGHVRVAVSVVPPGSFPASLPAATTEAFHVLEGVFFLTNPDGSARRCVAGDTVLLPEGWTGHCDVIESAKRIGVIVG
eukprot:CAMPEP_0194267468 /NCGR_PEP_ID=MMETSP0169-20130528/1950_1 /TAXON_ID=218684 /ORGANISM="Corethron pennatum, Strain L29A3" /LENGTH=578 /DNA_ID=CAMNT_0039008301 /DNA_START=125 /DNA_END=1861 /DNA_ORIENTATION=+